ncbi:hypothetical protein FRX31_004486 [Thalictrum thalictroides]|uniref:Uncharacterized protein n=1 Tax=Thalictrum thalictroides TaxID=46969 RepID=A0A7J6XAG0_THATH|nr:hypothetical protein FRX31_004486 [Thalictrum thalictroides]
MYIIVFAPNAPHLLVQLHLFLGSRGKARLQLSLFKRVLWFSIGWEFEAKFQGDCVQQLGQSMFKGAK